MDTKVIQIQGISVTELSNLIKDSVDEVISNLHPSFIKEDEDVDELLTRKQVLEMLKISSVTLWNWQKSGKIIVHGIHNRRYYKHSEIINCLTMLKP